MIIALTLFAIYFIMQTKFNDSEKAYNDLQRWRMGWSTDVEPVFVWDRIDNGGAGDKGDRGD